MAAIGKKLRSARGADDKRILHWCPACEGPHAIRIEGGPPVWTFDGNYDKPTFSPSILLFHTETADDNDKPLPAPVRVTLCHYFIKAGQIVFCSDCPHKLSGQTVDLPDWPYAPGAFGGIDDAETP